MVDKDRHAEGGWRACVSFAQFLGTDCVRPAPTCLTKGALHTPAAVLNTATDDMSLARNLRAYEARHYSQHDEDGVIARLFELVGTTNRYFVEFGVEDGLECNSRRLRQRGWSGIMMDRDHDNPELALYRETVTAENVNRLFAKYGVPRSFDLLSIDIDGNDYWVWKAITQAFEPQVVVVEFNAAIPVEVSVAMPYEPEFRWRGEAGIGQSLRAVQKLGRERGYCLVYANPPAAFLVLRPLLPRSFHEPSVNEALLLEADELHAGQRARWQHELQFLSWVHV